MHGDGRFVVGIAKRWELGYPFFMIGQIMLSESLGCARAALYILNDDASYFLASNQRRKSHTYRIEHVACFCYLPYMMIQSMVNLVDRSRDTISRHVLLLGEC